MPGEVYREKTIQLTEGDRLCFYTDGLIETRNEIGENFGTERLVGCMDTYGTGSAEKNLRATSCDANMNSAARNS